MALVSTKTVSVKAFFDKELAQEVVESAALKGLRKLGMIIEAEAKKLCPVKTHALQESSATQLSKKNKTVTISFNTPYALRQHEEHKSKSKYLERPFNELSQKAEYYAENEIANATIKAKAQKWGY